MQQLHISCKFYSLGYFKTSTLCLMVYATISQLIISIIRSCITLLLWLAVSKYVSRHHAT